MPLACLVNPLVPEARSVEKYRSTTLSTNWRSNPVAIPPTGLPVLRELLSGVCEPEDTKNEAITNCS